MFEASIPLKTSCWRRLSVIMLYFSKTPDWLLQGTELRTTCSFGQIQYGSIFSLEKTGCGRKVLNITVLVATYSQCLEEYAYTLH